MKEEMFEELKESIRQAGAIRRGELKPAKVTHYPEPNVKKIRNKLELSQSQFATLLGINVGTLQGWEQERRRPQWPARVLWRGSVWPSDFAHWDDLEVRRLRQLIDVEIEPDIEAAYPDKNGCRLEIAMNDGQILEAYVDYAKGEPEFRMSEAEVIAKFKALTKDVLAERQVDALFVDCMKLEKLADTRRLFELTTVNKNLLEAHDYSPETSPLSIIA